MFFPAAQQPQSPNAVLAAQIQTMSFLLIDEISELQLKLTQLEENPGPYTAPEIIKHQVNNTRQTQQRSENCLTVLSKLLAGDNRADILTTEDWQHLRNAQDDGINTVITLLEQQLAHNLPYRPPPPSP